MKTFLKYIYRQFIKYFFLALYGKISIGNYLNKNVKIKIISKNKIRKFNNSFYKICIIKNGRICTDGNEQVAYISENRIINDFSYTQIKGNLVSSNKNFVISKGTPYFLKKFNGAVLSLAQGASGNHNYFHWMFDILPKIKIALSYYNLKEINYFYMPKLQNFQKRILKYLGLSNVQFIDSNKYKHIQASKIIVTDHPWYYSGKVMINDIKLPAWITKWLRSIFLKKKLNYKIKKFFIDRSESKSSHFQFTNNKEIISELKKIGFNIIQVGKLDLIQQIALFNSAKIIVGAHGAAFTNLVFCKSKTEIIEVKNKNACNNYELISKQNNLNYKKFVVPVFSKKNLNGDIYINPKKIVNEIYKKTKFY